MSWEGSASAVWSCGLGFHLSPSVGCKIKWVSPGPEHNLRLLRTGSKPESDGRIATRTAGKIATIFPVNFGLLFIFPNWHKNSCLEPRRDPRAHGLPLVGKEIAPIRATSL